MNSNESIIQSVKAATSSLSEFIKKEGRNFSPRALNQAKMLSERLSSLVNSMENSKQPNLVYHFRHSESALWGMQDVLSKDDFPLLAATSDAGKALYRVESQWDFAQSGREIAADIMAFNLHSFGTADKSDNKNSGAS